ncbi:MAG: hypothetical protein WAM90_15730 [Rhodanobacter sp.]
MQLYDDGKIIKGTIAIDDFGFDGEDEYPIITVDVDGMSMSFFDHEFWRYVD